MLTLPAPTTYLALLHLITLLLGYLSLGWLLAAFQVPLIVWLVTLGITLHLIKSEVDALALANIWVVAIVTVGVLFKAWLPIWGDFQVRPWAIGLMVLWLWATVLVLLLAFAQKPLRSIGFTAKQAFQVLIIATWTALGLGWLINCLSR